MNRGHATVLHAFLESLDAHPEAVALRVVEHYDSARELSYADVFRLVRQAAAGFEGLGVRAGDRLVLATPTTPELLGLYLGALFRGVIPLMAPALRGGRKEEYLSSRLAALTAQVGARHLVVQEAVVGEAPAGSPVVAAEAFFRCGDLPILPLVRETDVAHLQPTSGSTGEQKVAAVSHRNIAANVAGIGSVIDLRPEDHLFIWLPLFHDMGLIAFSCTLYWQKPMTLTDPANFVRNPIRYWLQLMSRYKATITAAPNSAYQACTRLAARRRLQDVDLSSVRLAFWGAEPVHPDTVEDFCQAMEPYHYRREATLPVYGLAEATLAVSVPPVGRRPVVQQVDSLALLDGAGEGALEGAERRRMKVTSVGRVLPGHQLRIVSGGQAIHEDGRVGEIEVAGPSIVEGYWGRDERLTHADGFLPTGDLGYVRDEELYIVGRKKEIIIVGGRNLIPTELESLVDRIVDSGIQKGVAAVALHDASQGTDAVHLLVESQPQAAPDRLALEERIRDGLGDAFGLRGAYVHWVPRGTLPKTTSGKMQRFLCRQLAERLVQQQQAPTPRAAS